MNFFPQKTRGVVFTAPRKVEVWEFDLRKPEPGDVIVEVEYSGISAGTERWVLTGERPEDAKYPHVPGYQNVGKIIYVGPDVKNWKIGDRVAGGTSKLLEGGKVKGWGAHVAHAVIQANRIVKIPDEVSLQEASMHWLFAVGYRGVRMTEIKPGDLVVVIGLGIIGQGYCQIARLKGAKVIGVDIKEKNLEIASKYSCDIVANSKKENLKEIVMKEKPAGADIAVEAIGKNELIPTCIDLLRVEGKLVWQGWYPGNVSFYFHQAHGKMVHMIFPCYLERQDEVLKLISEGKLRLSPFISHTFNAEDAPKAYELILNPPPDMTGIVLKWK